MPLLLQTVEKASAQSSQHALLAEGVAASVLLSRLAVLETQTGKAYGSTIALLLLYIYYYILFIIYYYYI